MRQRIFPLLALTLTASLLFTVIAHACSDLQSIRATMQAPCDHGSPQDEPRGKSEKDTCGTVRYGMLSTQASFETELAKSYSTASQDVLVIGFLLPAILSDYRSQAPPSFGLGASPYLSHIVLRI
jgi:hypothetical protein